MVKARPAHEREANGIARFIDGEICQDTGMWQRFFFVFIEIEIRTPGNMAVSFRYFHIVESLRRNENSILVSSAPSYEFFPT